MLTSPRQNLMVGAHNRPRISDVETTPARAGSSTPPPCEGAGRRRANVLQHGCLSHAKSCPPLGAGCPAPHPPITASSWGGGVTGAQTRHLSLCCLPCLPRQTTGNACPRHQGPGPPPWALLPPRRPQLAAALGLSRRWGCEHLHLPSLS